MTILQTPPPLFIEFMWRSSLQSKHIWSKSNPHTPIPLLLRLNPVTLDHLAILTVMGNCPLRQRSRSPSSTRGRSRRATRDNVDRPGVALRAPGRHGGLCAAHALVDLWGAAMPRSQHDLSDLALWYVWCLIRVCFCVAHDHQPPSRRRPRGEVKVSLLD